jgi:glycosyltransferase involved in cell wall biosynthesis
MSSRIEVAIGPVFNEFNGVSRHILAIQKYSSNNIHVIAPKPFRMILNNRVIGWNYYMKILSKFGLGRYDIIHSHADPWFTRLCASEKIKDINWVHTYHTMYFEEDNPGGLQHSQVKTNEMLINVANHADIKICISKWFHDYLLDKFSIDTTIIPNGADLYACEKAVGARFTRKYGLSDFIIFIGNIQHVKNPVAFIKLAKMTPKMKFVMVGQGLTKEKIFQTLGIEISSNLYAFGELGHKDTLDALAASKVFLMTSKSEGIPTVLIEAMALAKPVVVPNITGCKEVVGDARSGYIYASDNYSEMIDCCNNALSNELIGKVAQKRAYQKFDWKVITPLIDKLYSSG